jgi:ribonuclease HI
MMVVVIDIDIEISYLWPTLKYFLFLIFLNVMCNSIHCSRVAGAGGVIICPRGIQALSIHWNLDITTNNQAKAYAMYQGLFLAKSLNIHSLSVVGESKLIIGHARKGSHPLNFHLKTILQ